MKLTHTLCSGLLGGLVSRMKSIRRGGADFITSRLRDRQARSASSPSNSPDSAVPTDSVLPEVSALQHVTRELIQVTSDSERSFLLLAGQLEQLPGLSESLVTRSERLLEMAAGRKAEPGLMERTLEQIQRPLQFVDAGELRLEGLATELCQAVRNIDRLIASEKLLRRSVSSLTFVQIHFKIESAGLSHETQQMFQALTQDMGRLHAQVSETFSQKFQVLKLARHTITTVTEQLRKDAITRGKALKVQRASVEKAIAHLQDDLAATKDRDVRITDISQSVASEINSMVMAMQIQDIVSQKLAHIVQALEEIVRRSRLGVVSSEDGGTDPGEFCETSCRVQDAQLTAIQEQIRKATEDILGATQNVKKSCAKLDEESLGLGKVEKLITNVDGLIQLLLDTLNEVLLMIKDMVATISKAYSMLSPIGGMASDLTRVVRQFSVQIKLIALNAQVQAAQQSGGTGLEVLASNTALVSTEAGAISESMAEGVDSLIANLNALVSSFETMASEGSREQQCLEQGIEGTTASLHRHRDATFEELRFMGEEIQEILASIIRMEQEATDCSGIVTKLEPTRIATSVAAEAISKAAQRTGWSSSGPKLRAELSRNYSVGSEHEILAKVLRSLAIDTGEIQETPRTEVLFEIQGDEAGVGADDRSPTHMEQVCLATSAPSENKQDLGDNVELF